MKVRLNLQHTLVKTLRKPQSHFWSVSEQLFLFCFGDWPNARLDAVLVWYTWLGVSWLKHTYTILQSLVS